MSWSLTGGDHAGQDWIINSNISISGEHTNIGRFRIISGTTVTIPFNNAYKGLKIEADYIDIFGVLNGDGGGNIGGNGGNGFSGVNGISSGGLGSSGGSGGAGGLGNSGVNSEVIGCQSSNGSIGGSGGSGFYGVVTQNEDVFPGSGGGGGGGGGAGSRFGENNNYPAGTGGGGGGGGPGGAMIILNARLEINITGNILSNGTRGSNGLQGGKITRSGGRYDNPAGGFGGFGNVIGFGLGASGQRADVYHDRQTEPGIGRSNTVGGNGGNGGLGSGGGILLDTMGLLNISGTININGNSPNDNTAGVLKIRAGLEQSTGTLPNPSRIVRLASNALNQSVIVSWF